MHANGCTGVRAYSRYWRYAQVCKRRTRIEAGVLGPKVLYIGWIVCLRLKAEVEAIHMIYHTSSPSHLT